MPVNAGKRKKTPVNAGKCKKLNMPENACRMLENARKIYSGKRPLECWKMPVNAGKRKKNACTQIFKVMPVKRGDL